MNNIKIELPFSGFYESIYDSHIDNTMEYYLYDLEGEQLEKAQNAFYMMNYDATRKAICEHYIQAYNQVFYDQFNIDLNLTFNSLISPKFYNFETDRLFVNIDPELFKQVIQLLDDDAIQKTLSEKYKTRDGFIVFESTIEAIKNKEYELFSSDLLEMLLPENDILDNWQFTDNIHEIISNSFSNEVWEALQC